MFESLQERLGSILNGLTGRGALSESDVTAALREVRRALIEADVSLEVVRSFTDRVREKAVGAEILKSIKPGQMVVKIVHDELIEMLGTEGVSIDLNAPAPVVIMMVGLQGSGKTTTTGKIAKRLTERQHPEMILVKLLAPGQRSPRYEFVDVGVAGVIADLVAFDPGPCRRRYDLARLRDDVAEADLLVLFRTR